MKNYKNPTTEMKKAGIIDFSGGFNKKDYRYVGIVDLRKIQVADYQRILDRGHVNYIDRNFDVHAVSRPMISFRDSVCRVTNGQHTKDMLIGRGLHFWPCEIHLDLTYEHEAALFYLCNEIPKRMGDWKSFAAAFIGRMQPHTRIMEIVEEVGLKTPLHEGNPDLVSATVLLRLYAGQKGSEPNFRKFLNILKRCWMTGKGKTRRLQVGITTQFQRGLTNFIFNNPEVSTNMIVCELREFDVEEIRELATEIQHALRADRPDQKQYRMAFETLVLGSPKPVRATQKINKNTLVSSELLGDFFIEIDGKATLRKAA